MEPNETDILKQLPIGDFIRGYDKGDIKVSADTLSEVVRNAFTNQTDQIREHLQEITPTILQEVPNMSRNMLSNLSSLVSNENTVAKFMVTDEENDKGKWNEWTEFRALEIGLRVAVRIMEKHNIT